ncbi:MAG TPA: hypothetical protein VKT81_08070 [Bryobacteraceae bacterium]|nr:hypothetical protein [Bryobacteraceae bacterium]
MSERTWRTLAGVAVLVLLGLILVRLTPPYFENWKLQRYLNDLADDPEIAKRPPDLVRSDILNKSASLGLPVHGGDVQVSRFENALKIEVLYIVHVDLPGYTVDLHFRPAAGGS